MEYNTLIIVNCQLLWLLLSYHHLLECWLIWCNVLMKLMALSQNSYKKDTSHICTHSFESLSNKALIICSKILSHSSASILQAPSLHSTAMISPSTNCHYCGESTLSQYSLCSCSQPAQLPYWALSSPISSHTPSARLSTYGLGPRVASTPTKATIVRQLSFSSSQRPTMVLQVYSKCTSGITSLSKTSFIQMVDDITFCR